MSIYDTLNEQQKKGVFTIKGPVLLLAGAGSGKTRVLTHRIAYLIEELGVNPWNIMAITFTNKAAGEMKERVETLVGKGSESIWVTTFHSTCVRILRRYADRLGYDNHFTIYDTDDQKSVMKEICKRLKIDTKLLKERSILAAISSAKDELISPKEYELNAMGDFRKQKIAQAYNEYQEALRKSNAMDFDDLIVKTVELFKADREVLDGYQKRFKYIMVDEYQDTNTAQFELVRLLADASHNLCVVGDDDQSIYKFRGANIRNILDFEKVYPEAAVIRLEQNYRSTKNVLDAANAVIRNNKGRKSKTLWTDKKDGSLIHFRQFDQAYEEAEFIADDVVRKKRDGIADYGDCAVLYRTNAQARLLEERFVVEGIPYNVVGGTNFYARREIKDLLAYLKTIDNGRDDLAVKRIINVPRRGIGAATIAKVQDYADIREMSFYDALCQMEDVPGIGKSASKLESFVTMIQGFRSKVEYYGLEGLIKDVIETTGYVSELEASDDEDAENRIENIDELISKVVAFETEHDEPTLGEFLEEVALVADIDNVESGNNKVLLMTLHSAKGLEFPHIYLAGMEDGIFPGYMTIASDDPGDMEEERRLAYVGITRAKEDLTLSCARMRMIRGETQMNAVSRFVREIPQELMDNRAPVSRFKTMAEGEDEYEPAGNRESLYRPVAALKPGRTAVENKPFIAGGGLGSLAAAGISKGVGAVTGGKPDYDIGDRVKHVKYGEGTVTDLEPGPRDYKVTVDFDDAGKKIMYAAFARLIRL
ncbi:ATP-dependent DNA helicase PcrA [Parablautia intestinalis]|uniref:ATP-dependent DNA helicase PcrA n=1 Tax=Parablautia intestinalis TaxID=2320100 RepID=A0A3A9ADM4_9FIRM|nr:UvrD-helicase domain-containing protein [Parablautia intestinalis]RKI89559.1 ATP-dependent DNA helicase PcrA [Parablautia intestinalis]